MNLKKVLIAAVAVIAVIAIYKMLTRVDHGNPIAVATAFTKAMKSKDTSTASKYVVPAKSESWLEATDDKIDRLKTNASEIYFEHLPENPQFSAPVTAAGKTIVVSADKAFTLEMTQIDGKWYVDNFQ